MNVSSLNEVPKGFMMSKWDIHILLVHISHSEPYAKPKGASLIKAKALLIWTLSISWYSCVLIYSFGAIVEWGSARVSNRCWKAGIYQRSRQALQGDPWKADPWYHLPEEQPGCDRARCCCWFRAISWHEHSIWAGEAPGDGLVAPVTLDIVQMLMKVIQAIQRGWLAQQWRELRGRHNKRG